MNRASSRPRRATSARGRRSHSLPTVFAGLLLRAGAVLAMSGVLSGVVAGLSQYPHSFGLSPVLWFVVPGAVSGLAFVLAARQARNGAPGALAIAVVAAMVSAVSALFQILVLGYACLDAHAGPLTSAGCRGADLAYRLAGLAGWCVLLCPVAGAAACAVLLAGTVLDRRSVQKTPGRSSRR